MIANKHLFVTGMLALMLAVSGCVTVQEHEKEAEVTPEDLDRAMVDRPAPLRPHVGVLLAQGERNAVLNNARLGVMAMSLGDAKAARMSLEDAALGIEAVYADNEAAEKARSNFVKENVKDFKGEPYERAMVYYYLGLTYLAEGDFENARASFKAGEFQDTLSAEETYQSDFALLNYLSGWASQCNGQPVLAEDAYLEAKTHRPALRIPERNHNTLVIYEVGDSPAKYADGQYKELLKLRSGHNLGNLVGTYDPGGLNVRLQEGADIFYQASTRGGREVDAVLAGKAQFKDGLDETGQALQTAGAATAFAGAGMGSRDAAAAGLAIMLAGAIAQGIADASQPEADIRYLDVLPARIGVVTANAPETEIHDFGGIEPGIVNVAPLQSCTLIWARDQDPVEHLPVRAPNSSDLAGSS